MTVFSFTHIEGTTLSAGEDTIGEVGGWASEGQAPGVYGILLQQGLSQRWDVEAGIKIGSDELTEVGRMVDHN